MTRIPSFYTATPRSHMILCLLIRCWIQNFLSLYTFQLQNGTVSFRYLWGFVSLIKEIESVKEEKIPIFQILQYWLKLVLWRNFTVLAEIGIYDVILQYWLKIGIMTSFYSIDWYWYYDVRNTYQHRCNCTYYCSNLQQVGKFHLNPPNYIGNNYTFCIWHLTPLLLQLE